MHPLYKSSQKRLCFVNLHVLPNFYPNLPIFLHGYIRHIRDISQLWNSVVKHQKILAESTLQTNKNGRVLLHSTGLAPAHNTPQAHSSSRMLESHIMFKTSGFSYSLFLVHIVAPIRSSCIAVLLSEAKVLITIRMTVPNNNFHVKLFGGTSEALF